MEIKAIFDFAPQRTFLIQGSENSFDGLVSDALVRYPFTNVLSAPRFTVDHAKNLVTFINEGTGDTRLFLVFFSIFSPDAAQVLLKSLEEPDQDTTIVLMTPYPYLVPATIRSRTMLMHADAAQAVSITKKLSRETVLAQIKEEFASDAEEDAATRRAKAVVMLDMLEAYVRSAPKKAAIIYKAKDMLFSANLPTKYILEYAASMVL